VDPEDKPIVRLVLRTFRIIAMASLSRLLAKDPSGAAPTKSSMATKAKAAAASFQGSRFFKGLGRIDEESSIRNMTSQDSSPRSTNSTDHSETIDWSMSLKNYNTKDNRNNKSNNKSKSSNNHNVTVVTSVTKVKDPKMDAAASAERRQDRSSPIPLKSQTPSPSRYSSSSSLPPSLPAPTRDHWQQQQPQKGHDEEQFKRKNKALQKECEELESIILQMKTEGNIFQTRTAIGLGNYQTEIEKTTQEKHQLQNLCKDLEDQIWSLRNETRLQQESIWDTEEKLQLQKRRQPRRLGNQKAASAMANK
jgi:hypothetical protein